LTLTGNWRIISITIFFGEAVSRKLAIKNSWRHNVMFLTRLNASVWAAILMTALIIPAASGEEAVTTPDTLTVGMIAPDFTLKDEEGVERNLSDYLGTKSVVLAFYPKDFTGG
jgi:cytochrome oxidase Cu insertion factor (SCO1/SenC/PrrC family)